MRRDWAWWIVLGVLLVGFGVWQALRPRPLDWTPTLRLDGSNPYDLRALGAVWPDLAPGKPLVRTRSSLLELLRDTTGTGGSVMVVGADLHLALSTPQTPLDSATARAADGFVRRGGTLALVGRTLSPATTDSLGLHRGWIESSFQGFVTPLADTARYRLTTSEGDTMRVPSVLISNVLEPTAWDARARTPLDPRVSILVEGCLDCDQTDLHPVLARVRRGGGSYVLSTGALALSNIALLEYDALPVAAALAGALPPGPVAVPEAAFAGGRPGSPLYALVRFPALRWAWYTLLAMGVVALAAYARRRQRALLPPAPPRNETAAFVGVVAALYRRRGDHANLAAKMASRFRHVAFDRYGLPLRAQTPEHIARRSGAATGEAARLLQWVERAEAGRLTTAGEIEAFAEHLAPFFERAPHTSLVRTA